MIQKVEKKEKTNPTMKLIGKTKQEKEMKMNYNTINKKGK